MIDVEEKYLETVKRILYYHVPECEVWIFGSRVTDKAQKYSDLDIALIGPQKIEPARMESLKDEFAESDLPFMVDVLDWHAISDDFRQAISQSWSRLQSCSA